jgi:hypothetical protein
MCGRGLDSEEIVEIRCIVWLGSATGSCISDGSIKSPIHQTFHGNFAMVDFSSRVPTAPTDAVFQIADTPMPEAGPSPWFHALDTADESGKRWDGAMDDFVIDAGDGRIPVEVTVPETPYAGVHTLDGTVIRVAGNELTLAVETDRYGKRLSVVRNADWEIVGSAPIEPSPTDSGYGPRGVVSTKIYDNGAGRWIDLKVGFTISDSSRAELAIEAHADGDTDSASHTSTIDVSHRTRRNELGVSVHREAVLQTMEGPSPTLYAMSRYEQDYLLSNGSGSSPLEN